jgi:hypothetical protein
MAESKADNTAAGLGCLVVLALVVGGLWWAGYTFFYAPGRRSESGAPPEVVKTTSASGSTPASSVRLGPPEDAVRMALTVAMPDVTPRLEFLEGSNLDIYVTRKEFEEIPFPDRSAMVERIGQAWCEKVDHTYLPVVQIRDIKTGEVFGKFSCTTDHVTIEEKH